MADPVAALAPHFTRAIEAAFGAAHAGQDPMLRPSNRADLQSSVAMPLAKQVKKPPREVADALVAQLDSPDFQRIVERVEVAPNGFINLTLATAWLAASIDEVSADARLGLAAAAQAKTVVIDYSAPNMAKEMHVGHLRSTIIGDALARVLEHLGHRVIRQNHIGDWGTPFGMLIEHLLDVGEKEAVAELSVGDLNAFYKQARDKFDKDPAFESRSRNRVVLLQGGDKDTLAQWKLLIDQSRQYFATAYRRLGVTLQDGDICGESFYNPDLQNVVDELQQKGLATVSDGALCVFPPGFTNKDGEPLPLIVRKSDGGFNYAATDLAAVRHRVGTLHADRALYVVGAPQRQHFAMVFWTARAAGWLPESADFEHVQFGSVLGPDKKMFKTRAGDSIRLIDLVDEATERALAVVTEKNASLDEATRAEVARMVGVGAVKYADLSSDRVKDYVFDWNQMLAFEGNTAPYLQYAHARIRSIFRRAEGQAADLGTAKVIVAEPAERALAQELLAFGTVVHGVGETLQPHKLCTYLYGLATAFSTFYEKCPVLKAPTPELVRSRLVLCDVTARVLARGLELLGIEAPQQM